MCAVSCCRRMAMSSLVGAALSQIMGRLATADVPSGVSSALRDLGASAGTARLGAHPLRLRHAGTGEIFSSPVLSVTANGLAWDGTALARLDWLMRDWREGLAMRIDRRIYVFLYLLQALSERLHGEMSLVELTSGFRTERTNALLRRTYGESVAVNSFHTQGRAVDFRVSGLSTRVCASLAWSLEFGGVGLYGDRFVHCDTGPRRRWGDPFPI